MKQRNHTGQTKKARQRNKLKHIRQLHLQKISWQHRFSHGGILRNKRAGRGARPLASKEPLHLVLKANREVIGNGFRIPRRFSLIHRILNKYAKKFYIKVEQVSVQGDHIHLLIRTTRRSLFQNFFRVLSGQIAQQFMQNGLMKAVVTDTPERVSAVVVTDTPGNVVADDGGESVGGGEKKGAGGGKNKKRLKLWKYRPFSRVVRGLKAYQTVKNYIRLNEKEALREIPYRKQRLKGLSNEEWESLWM